MLTSFEYAFLEFVLEVIWRREFFFTGFHKSPDQLFCVEGIDGRQTDHKVQIWVLSALHPQCFLFFLVQSVYMCVVNVAELVFVEILSTLLTVLVVLHLKNDNILIKE